MEEVFDTDYIIEQYVEKDRTAADIARELGCCEKTVSSKLRKNGIPTKRRIKQNLKQELTGKVFGRLKVLCLEKINDNNEYIWKCLCRCGEEKFVRARSLLCKDCPTRSCGCARRKNHNWEKVPPYILGIISAKAHSRGVKFDLTLGFCDLLYKKQNGRCALSGIPIVFGRRRDIKRTTASLDRIDSSLPYVEGNVQWVHKKINIMKHAFSVQEFINFCNLVSEFNK